MPLISEWRGHPGSAGRASLPPKEQGYLQCRVVRTERVRQRYHGVATAFLMNYKLGVNEEAQVADGALEKELWVIFRGGLDVSQATLLVHATKWFVSMAVPALPKAMQSLQGVRRECPQKAREPMVWEMAIEMACRLARGSTVQQAVMGAAILIGFDVYARPGGLLKINTSWIILPQMAISSFPSTADGASKTNTQDDTVEVGVKPERRWLRELLPVLVNRVPVNAPIFNFRLPTSRRSSSEWRAQQDFASNAWRRT